MPPPLNAELAISPSDLSAAQVRPATPYHLPNGHMFHSCTPSSVHDGCMRTASIEEDSACVQKFRQGQGFDVLCAEVCVNVQAGCLLAYVISLAIWLYTEWVHYKRRCATICPSSILLLWVCFDELTTIRAPGTCLILLLLSLPQSNQYTYNPPQNVLFKQSP